MANPLQQRLEQIATKAWLLTERYQRLVADKEQADRTISELQERVDRQQREIEQLRMKIDHLTMATTLTPGRQDVEMTKAVLAELVREIDRCINELTQ